LQKFFYLFFLSLIVYVKLILFYVMCCWFFSKKTFREKLIDAPSVVMKLMCSCFCLSRVWLTDDFKCRRYFNKQMINVTNANDSFRGISDLLYKCSRHCKNVYPFQNNLYFSKCIFLDKYIFSFFAVFKPYF